MPLFLKSMISALPWDWPRIRSVLGLTLVFWATWWALAEWPFPRYDIQYAARGLSAATLSESVQDEFGSLGLQSLSLAPSDASCPIPGCATVQFSVRSRSLVDGIRGLDEAVAKAGGQGFALRFTTRVGTTAMIGLLLSLVLAIYLVRRASLATPSGSEPATPLERQAKLRLVTRRALGVFYLGTAITVTDMIWQLSSAM